jgi:hypothetical protein
VLAVAAVRSDHSATVTVLSSGGRTPCGMVLLVQIAQDGPPARLRALKANDKGLGAAELRWMSPVSAQIDRQGIGGAFSNRLANPAPHGGAACFCQAQRYGPRQPGF